MSVRDHTKIYAESNHGEYEVQTVNIHSEPRVPRRVKLLKDFKKKIKLLLIFLIPKCLLPYFKPAPDPNKLEAAIRSAVLIQRWYRLHRASLELRHRYTWTIFQRIEYSSEQYEMQVYNFYRYLLMHMPTPKPPEAEEESLDLLDTEVWDVDQVSLKNYKKHKGIHINFPMKKADLHNLIEHFNNRKKPRLHATYVAKIIIEAIFQLRKLPNINSVYMNVSQEFTVCGDLHGQLDDLLLILQKNGFPSAENPYIFNGDFVDRGKYGLEVLLILLSCLLVFPDGMYLNRGNHEDLAVNERYGFVNEIQLKYRKHCTNLLKLIEELYKWIPLATIIDDRIFIVHGGISDNTELCVIRYAKRSKFDSILRPSDIYDGKTSEEDKKFLTNEWNQIRDVMWSDPGPNDGCIANKTRGAGTYFGPDVTSEFLEKNNFDYIIRSHECKSEGFEMMHDNKLITIFSASNYYSVGSNKGAFLKIFGSDLKYKVVQFNANKTKQLTFRQRIDIVESSAIRELHRHININRELLNHEFKKYDSNENGLISVKEWCCSMEHATQLALPWRLLREKLVTQDPESKLVLYNTTFSKYKQASNASNVMDILYDNKVRLQNIFRIIDKDNAGFICLEKLFEACNLINDHLPNPITRDQLKEYCNLMDTNKDGRIDLNEFLETFRMVNSQKNHEDCLEETSEQRPTSTL